jgi:hypothetical protein
MSRRRWATAAQRIALLPLLDLFLRAVEAGVAHRVTAEAIRHDLDEGGFVGGARPVDRLGDAALHLHDIIAVEAVARHAVADRAERHVLDGE